MNYRLTIYTLGEIAMVVGAIMCIPLFVAIGLGEDLYTTLGYAIAIGVTLLLGIFGIAIRPHSEESKKMKASSGFIVCALAWILIGLIGAIPYRVSGYFTNYFDAMFETFSGFSTTGSSILSDVEILPKSLLLWRSMTQWIGGMGVLVFVIAISPKNEKMSTAIAKAEIPGPQFGKLVSKLKSTSQILYAFYIVLTLLLVLILWLEKMPIFDSFCHAFTTASTGGFSIKNGSIAAYNSVPIEVTITIFMIIFSINFNIFYLVIVSRYLRAFKNEEMISMFAIMLVSVVVISVSLTLYNTYSTVAESLRYSTFQVASLMSTTGFDNTPIGTDYTSWPVITQAVLAIIMLIGGSAGSTAGGMKVSRITILYKSSAQSIKKQVSPRTINTVKFNGKPLQDDTVQSVETFFVMYILIVVISTVLISIDSPYTGTRGFLTNFTAVLTCISNVGPGFGFVGPDENFADYGHWAQIVMCLDMLAGRLEIIPIVLLFHRKSWIPFKTRRAK